MGNAILIYGVFMILIITAGVIFGIRSGQFKKQKNANRLPLEIDDSKDDKN